LQIAHSIISNEGSVSIFYWTNSCNFEGRNRHIFGCTRRWRNNVINIATSVYKEARTGIY